MIDTSKFQNTHQDEPRGQLEPVPETTLPSPFDDYFLSSLRPSDFPRLVELYNSDLAFILFSPPYPYTLNDAQWFNDNRAHTRFPSYPGTQEAWVIRSKSHDGMLVGICGTHPMPGRSEHHFRLGYFLAPEFRGKGIMSMVVAEVLKKFPGSIFDAEAEVANLGSQKVLEKCGFQHVEGGGFEETWPASKGGGVRQLLKFKKQC
ncbi:hypothetical protein AOL_s00170g106 [Orbilia oligospora ATCC 24927]|uniref:N-acetyltransferase domain-containing protein n=1 Tax=Arthrobotrys oligospora (strain ATCC 24927 / CBS 115.81 / DSM 1491) TaxID=756982 RepID=G1XNE0_ARTOA|nr:hypothetical protein AOL_s00170g106 [Orbilia oligospora ATCC 24927]EGX45399.1 hypothetical protein AOL_s00170g106 [Orbilia oligospora ATCC 24927]